MNIKILKKYRLTSSARDFQISESIISQGEKTKGERVETNITYHLTLEAALNNVIKRSLLTSEATSLPELLKELQDTRTEIRKIWKQEL